MHETMQKESAQSDQPAKRKRPILGGGDNSTKSESSGPHSTMGSQGI